MDTLIEPNPRAVQGGNFPPDPIDTATAPFGDLIAEVGGWLDGQRVTTEGQMNAVDRLIKDMKSARKAIDAARDAATGPLHQAWKAEIARWKPTQDDFDMQVSGMVALVDQFKRQLAADKAEAARQAWAAAQAARAEAEALAALADPADIEAQREAAQARDMADIARADASAASRDTVKGLRTYVTHTITDGTACAKWIWANDREALLDWMYAYVVRSKAVIDGVQTLTEKRAV